MAKHSDPRKGVASVIGTLLFVVVLVAALGAQAFMSSLQAQSSQISQEAQQLSARRNGEVLSITSPAGGPTVTNVGGESSKVISFVLRYPNGTAFDPGESFVLSSGASTTLGALVPAGTCGGSTCLSKYNKIVSGAAPAGSMVGIVTSLGNVVWYAPSAYPQADPSGSGERTTADQTTSGTNVYISTGLTVSLSANTAYSFFAFTAVTPATGIEKYDFEIHSLPAGATLVIACSPMSYPVGGGNQATNCVSSTGTPVAAVNNLGFGVSPPVYATPGLFGTVVVGGTAGTLQIDFACTASCGSVTVKAGSFIVVQQVP